MMDGRERREEMARFKVGDRAKFVKSRLREFEKRTYLGRKGIVVEVDENTRRTDGTYGEMVRIAFIDGSILNVRDDARNAIHYTSLDKEERYGVH